ncbi:hypothetical protein SNOG_11756 [Parastagonospora nodorum SN15]|uniref:Uncharacterized protein n=1 Tax=Phaeosphaeria nodorum (strain SN15 / ATCC MYA-4574 / FGSC 10173) TaxID=321614 RepID=Q0U908_PHANO|nr:hypothetical protein SNOG_11756 [Parastagonospora nodorum SN15]EAT80800.1 hypothetical protein SNOG_11756 [Parastagonospora nodorum SN15]
MRQTISFQEYQTMQKIEEAESKLKKRLGLLTSSSANQEIDTTHFYQSIKFDLSRSRHKIEATCKDALSSSTMNVIQRS